MGFRGVAPGGRPEGFFFRWYHDFLTPLLTFPEEMYLWSTFIHKSKHATANNLYVSSEFIVFKAL